MKKIAIITGASSGIGREFARSLTDHGLYDELWAIARNKERLEALQKEVPIPVKAISMDLADPAFIPEMEALLHKEQPDVRLLINASGFGKFQSVEKIPLEDNLGMIDLNCRVLAAMTQLALPYMHRGAGVIEVASVAAFQPIPYINVYGATKAFVLSYARALNREWKKKGIHVMALCPFWTRTAFFNRAVDEETIVKKYAAMYDPAYIVRYAWKALSRKREYCIPGWTARLQVLGVKILPHRFVMDIWMRQQELN